MFSTKTRTAIATLAVVGSVAAASAPAYALAPGGTTTTTTHTSTTTTVTAAKYQSQRWVSGTDDERCVNAANAADSWANEADTRYANGDMAGAKAAQANADAIAGQANMQGCDIIDYPVSV
jgi:hypothetical protein